MRFALMLVLGFSVALVSGTPAQDKDVTFNGKITCAKCELKQAKKCMTVIVVKGKDGKDFIVYFEPKSHKAYHSAVCRNRGKQGSVTGSLSRQGDRLLIAVKKVEFK